MCLYGFHGKFDQIQPMTSFTYLETIHAKKGNRSRIAKTLDRSLAGDKSELSKRKYGPPLWRNCLATTDIAVNDVNSD